MFGHISLQTNNHSPVLKNQKKFKQSTIPLGKDLPSEPTKFLKQVQSLSVIRYKDNLWEIK